MTLDSSKVEGVFFIIGCWLRQKNAFKHKKKNLIVNALVRDITTVQRKARCLEGVPFRNEQIKQATYKRFEESAQGKEDRIRVEARRKALYSQFGFTQKRSKLTSLINGLTLKTFHSLTTP